RRHHLRLALPGLARGRSVRNRHSASITAAMDPTDEVAQQLARTVRRKRRRRPGSRDPVAWAARQPAPVSPAQQQGGKAESRALDYLVERGLAPVTSNFRCKAGEIDLIVRDGDVLVFVEVRIRRNPYYGGAAASVDHGKRDR